MSKHPHYDLIVQWASDPERWGVQRFCAYSNAWFLTANQKYPTWVTDHKYRLIDRYAGPLTEEPEMGYYVFRCDPYLTGNMVVTFAWKGSEAHKTWLRRRLLYNYHVGAEARAREIIESGGGEV